LSKVKCKYCHEEFNVQPSRVLRLNYCSSPCRERANSIIKAVKKIERTRNCVFCNKEFTPRPYQIKTGNGKYCSINCRNVSVLPLLQTPEAKKKSKETYMANLKAGLIQHPSGKNHPKWKGGDKETVKRRIADGRANQSVKAYRKNNPDKAREWSSTRQKRKTGRLPKGTVKSIGDRQKWLCVYCNIDISSKYHVDHIHPLSKGGQHVPNNIQLTCPSCNVKKSNKLNYRSSENNRMAV
jgi:5-methylcytosine-specific restriction endonuclease McrA